jgi:glycosyltransferase involved in cell wall biosynthesis
VTEHNEYQNFETTEIPCQEISDPDVLSKNPLVSVHMITYNHELYIAQAIEGVLMQETNFPIELIIGEDCSADDTLEIVLDYQKKHTDIIKIITSDKNVGAIKNYKRVAKACRGKYIAFCEGDDYWHHPKKLQRQVDLLENHQDCGLVHSDVVWNNLEMGERIPAYYKYRKLSHNHENVVRNMIEHKYIVINCSAVVRKGLFDEIHETCQFEFSENFMMGDTQMWIEIAYRSKVKYIDEPLATLNLLPDSISNPKAIEKKIEFAKNMTYMSLHYANKYGGEDAMEISKSIVRKRNRSLIALAFRARNPDLGREIHENAGKYQVPLSFVGYLYFAGTQNIVAYYLVNILILPMRLGRKIHRVINMFRHSLTNS